MGDGGGGHWLVQMEWCPSGWSVCLPLLIFPCTIKSRSSLLAPCHLDGPGKNAVKRLLLLCCCCETPYFSVCCVCGKYIQLNRRMSGCFCVAHIPLFLYPFLHTVSKTRPFEYLRLTSLGVIGALVKVCAS